MKQRKVVAPKETHPTDAYWEDMLQACKDRDISAFEDLVETYAREYLDLHGEGDCGDGYEPSGPDL